MIAADHRHSEGFAGCLGNIPIPQIGVSCLGLEKRRKKKKARKEPISHRVVELVSILCNSFACVNGKMKRIPKEMGVIISKRNLKS